MRGIFTASRKLGLPFVIDMRSFTPHSSAFFNHHANCYTKMLMIQSASHIQLLIYQVTERMKVIQKEDNFGKLLCHCLLRKNSETTQRCENRLIL